MMSKYMVLAVLSFVVAVLLGIWYHSPVAIPMVFIGWLSLFIGTEKPGFDVKIPPKF